MNAIEPYDFIIGSMDKPTRCRVVEMAYQRNGVGGVGFWQLRLLCSEAPERPLLAVLFDEGSDDGVCAVFDPNDFASHWRGDVFEPGLRECVRARQDEYFGVPA